jgi:hypothetical protein
MFSQVTGRTASAFLLALAAFPLSSIGKGEVIVPGSQYLNSTEGHYIFSPGEGFSFFHGVPLGYSGIPGNADTILHRLEAADLPGVGSTATISVEAIALSAEGNSPISIGARLYDYRFSLNPNVPSTGYMLITLDRPDDGTSTPNGTYTNHVTLNFTAFFTPVDGGPGAFTADRSIFIESVSPGTWSFHPEPNYWVIVGAPGDITADVHEGLPSGLGDFFLIGDMPMVVAATGDGGIHSPCKFPEPSTWVLLASGIVGLGSLRRLNRPSV